ncbi:MAG TPA: LamG-like jellyroll fold domain-containing protein [Sedimentisphaerales bacterium]|nr:LamG-like jellyroll fold domain-containing protein [Sedimentisphaerales bacterium]
MHTKLIYLTCLILVLGPALTSTASAEIVGWWKFDEGSGTIAQDSSRYNNDVFFNGEPQWVAGYYNGGLEFDGSDDCLDRGVYEPSLDIVGELTFTAWVKPGATLRDHKIGGNITTGANGGGYMMGIYSNDMVELEVRSSAGTSAPPSRPGGGTVLQTGTWYFLAATYSQTADGGIITTYVNGAFDAELVTTIVMDPSPGTFVIGRDPQIPGLGQFIGVMDDVRVYNHVLTENELRDAMLGKWPPSEIAFAPRPEDEQVDVPRDAALGWTPGIYAQTHDVYFGEVFEDVGNAEGNNPLGVLVSQNQVANTYVPTSLLDFGQTYFWRIDDINAVDSTIHTGDIWRFTTETIGYPIPADKIRATASSFQDADTEPGKTIDGSGLVNDLHSIDTTNMWLSDTGDPGSAWIQYDFDKLYKLHEMLVWNYNGPFLLTGFSIRDATIEYSTDGATWTVLPDANEFAQAPGTDGYQYNTTVDFNGVVAKSVRITANSNWGGPIFSQYGLSEVRFLYIPVNAREPNPDSGATDADLDVRLRWRPGREAVEHDVYLSDDEQAVIDGTAPVETVTDTSYSPLSLDLGKTYYWKINEVNMAETPTTLEGDIWSFSTSEYLVVDDFEDYDTGDNQIWYAWKDGLGYGTPENPPYSAGNGTGSAVGWDTTPSYTEETIVHGGKQSMPLFYSNTDGAIYSEAERTFALPQDWTKAGVQTLVLFFHGTAENTGQLYVKVNGSKVAYDGNVADIEQEQWNRWNIDLASLGAELQNVTTLTIGIDGNDAGGTLYFDDIGLYVPAP